MSEITLVDGDTVCIPHGFELCRAGGYGGGSRGGFIYSVKAKETPKDDDEIYDHEAHCNRILARMPESTRLAIVQSTMVIFSECRKVKTVNEATAAGISAYLATHGRHPKV